MSSQPATILILGMHRSGTSCLAGSLEQAGLELANSKGTSPYNALGNREDRRFKLLNEGVLRDNKANWRSPPSKPVVWSDRRREQQRELIDSFPEDRPWGFKDPRTLLTIDGWIDALPNARAIASLRHPHAVARSLEARNGLDIETGIALWLNYNRRLLELCLERDVEVVDFDWPPARYREAVESLAANLGLQPEGGADFLEPELKHHDIAEEVSLEPEALQTYRALREQAASLG